MKKLLLAGLMFAANALAGDCHTILDNTKRLACYDKEHPVKKDGIAKEKSKKIDLSHWETKTEVSKIDDSTTVIILNKSSESVNGKYEVTTPSMIIRCKNNKTELYFNWGQSLDTDIYGVKAKVRLDSDKPKTYKFSASTDFSAAFVSKPITFIKKAFEHDKMVVQMATAFTAPSSVTFNIKGLGEVIKPLRKACNW